MSRLALVALLIAAVAGCDSGGSSRHMEGAPGGPIPPGKGRISGRVVDRRGAPVAGATIEVFSDHVVTSADDDGVFLVEVASGEHRVVITAPDWAIVFDGMVEVVGGQETRLSLGYVTYDPQSGYVGGITCKECHSREGEIGDGIYDVHARSGHAAALTPVIDGQTPHQPFAMLEGVLERIFDDGETERVDLEESTIVPGNGLQTDNALGTPISWDDVSFVIGGSGWKTVVLDRDGYVVTGSGAQYNVAADEMVALHDDEMNRVFDCGKCHTTGWQSFGDNGGVHQDGLPGLDGTFAIPSVDCEACHGPGRSHAYDPLRYAISVDSSSELCGRCHSRDGQNRIVALGGLIRQYEQFDELVRVGINLKGEVVDREGEIVPADVAPATRLDRAAMGGHYLPTVEFPDGVGCSGCHDPHATTKFDALTEEVGIIRECVDCHPDKVRDSGTRMTVGFEGAELECVDCHMPRMSRSAVATPGLGSSPTTGDLRSHVFAIDLGRDDQFTADGGLAFPFITKHFACLTCHGSEDRRRSVINLTDMDFADYRFHTDPAPTTISGLVLDRFGQPVANVQVKLPALQVTVESAADGTFSAQVVPGRHVVVITAADGVVLFDDRVEITAGQDNSLSLGRSTYDPGSDYVGRLTCKQCHSVDGGLRDGTYDAHARSGHAYQLNRVTEGREPEFPFTSIAGALELLSDEGEDERIDRSNGDAIVAGNGLETDNSLGTPISFEDISYVIGGFARKARFLDLDGYLVTGSSAEFHVETASTAPYHDNEKDKPYDCGRCHTTGWLSLEDNGGVNQDGLPGILGTFAFAGVECEACHGPGKSHIAAPSSETILVDRRSELCGRCHSRDSQNRIGASDDLIRHEQQFDELLRLRVDVDGQVVDADGTPVPPDAAPEVRIELAAQGGHYVPNDLFPDGVGCNGCHNPHATTRFDARTLERGFVRDCVDCHPEKIRDEGTLMTTGFAGARLQCIDCHMPEMTLSARSAPPQGSGPPTGDIRSHVFAIDMTASEQFVAGGRFLNPVLTSQYACLRCHGGGPDSVSLFDLTGLNLGHYVFHDD